MRVPSVAVVALVGLLSSIRARAADVPAPPVVVTATQILVRGAVIPIPQRVADKLGAARVSEVRLTSGRHVARVDVPLSDGVSWSAIIGEAPAGGAKVVWSGVAGEAQGEHGESRATVIVDEAGPRGHRLLVGKQREELSLCGRPTVVAAREVDPTTLELKRGASLRSISEADRAAATPLTAKRITAPAKAPTLRLLSAKVASSAVGQRMTTISDGDPETVWSEGKRGAGEGEFVVFSSAKEVGIDGIELAIRPPTAKVAHGSAPKRLLFATDERLYSVAMPDDGWTRAGSRYAVSLPETARTRCFAVVIDEGFGRGDDAATTIAEIVAHTDLDSLSLAELALALSGGEERAMAASALLERGGAEAREAVIASYERLDDRGRELARRVIDGGPCAQKSRFYAAYLVVRDDKGKVREPSPTDGESIHAHDQVRRCGREAAPALAERFESTTDDAAKVVLAAELALTAPAEAVAVLSRALGTAPDRTRRALRRALGRALDSERAGDALDEALEPSRFAELPAVARIDLLRAAGPRLGVIDSARAAFATLATPAADFRTRYLLIAPASRLAASGDEVALTFVRDAIGAKDLPELRAHAVQAATSLPVLDAEVLAALSDPEPRVRLAAMAAPADGEAASGARPPTAAFTAKLADLLGSDPWTYIRVGAAEALAALPPSAAADAALGRALGDPLPAVRGAAVDALGVHGARAQRELVRERMTAPDEVVDVRARAIIALGAMCDASSMDDLTKLARRAASPQGEGDQRLGMASLTALGVLHPSDLAKRLAPLLDPSVPHQVRDLAKEAIAGRGQCSAGISRR